MYKKLSIITLVVLALSLVTVGSVFAQGNTPENPGETVEGPRDNRPGRPFDGPQGRPVQRPERSTAVADALGMTAEEMREALQSGQTIEELAAEKGIDLQTIVLEEFTSHMQTAVEEGRLTQEEADEKLADFIDQIESGEMPFRGHGPQGKPGEDYGPQRGDPRSPQDGSNSPNQG